MRKEAKEKERKQWVGRVINNSIFTQTIIEYSQ